MSSIMIIQTILRTMFIELDVLGVKIKLYILLFLIKLKLFLNRGRVTLSSRKIILQKLEI